jgi:hypothetical protein
VDVAQVRFAVTMRVAERGALYRCGKFWRQGPLLQFLHIRRSLFLRQDLTGLNSDVAKIVRGLSRRKANAYRRPTIQGGRQPTVRLLFTSG